MTELDGALRLAIAALVGLGVGVEREWTIHASGRPPRFAGLRTFSMLGLLVPVRSARPLARKGRLESKGKASDGRYWAV